jgi:hypothetical protein
MRLPALLSLLLLGCGALSRPLPEADLIQRVEQLASASDSAGLADLAERQCRGLEGEDRQKCFEDYFLTLSSEGRVRIALAALSVLGERDRKIAADGHGLTHVIGIKAWQPGRDVVAVFNSCTGLYQSGCYHGVVQAYFTGEGDVDSTMVATLCDRIQGETGSRWLRFQCVHGIGHGLEMVWNWDLPRVLTGCDWLPSDWDRQGCYGGAFMENGMASMPGGHHTPARAIEAVQGKTPAGTADEHAGHEEHAGHMSDRGDITFKMRDSTDLLYPCTVVEQRYRAVCYMLQGSVILGAVGSDFAKAATACDQAQEDLRQNCYLSLGTAASGMTVQNTPKAIQLCSKGDPGYQPWCFVGVVKNYVDVTANPEDGFRFCEAVPAGNNKRQCYVAVGEQIHVLNPRDTAARRRGCERAKPEGREECLYGAWLRPAPEGLPLIPPALGGKP